LLERGEKSAERLNRVSYLPKKCQETILDAVNSMQRVRIGTSGWTYSDWRGTFYPKEVPARRWLSWYAEQFLTAEINGSFYRTPSLEAVRHWRQETPDGFVFAWKASKFITHWKRLSSNCRNSLDLMETRLAVLEPKVGPILFQLPPQLKFKKDLLGGFIKLLKRKREYVFEFRDQSWYHAASLSILRDHNIALCFSDHHVAPAPWSVTANFVYIRGHGPTGKYHGRYAKTTLDWWARQIRQWRRKGLKVYCYFDNDQKSAAPKDAQRLIQMVTPRSKAHGKLARY
jgi:uncharacterized protein YecE (DUF72 family)